VKSDVAAICEHACFALQIFLTVVDREFPQPGSADQFMGGLKDHVRKAADAMHLNVSPEARVCLRHPEAMALLTSPRLTSPHLILASHSVLLDQLGLHVLFDYPSSSLELQALGRVCMDNRGCGHIHACMHACMVEVACERKACGRASTGLGRE
jgi:hypothetical protein